MLSKLSNQKGKSKMIKTIVQIKLLGLLLFALILLFSCAPYVSRIPGNTLLVKIDFSKYSKEDFLITPYEYRGDYEAIGLISNKVAPEAHLVEKNIDNAGVTITKKEWQVEFIDVKKMIDELYKNAINMGANAIVDLKNFSSSEVIMVSSTKSITIESLEIRGFAIKRLGAFK